MRHRRLVVLRGTPEQTRWAAHRYLQAIQPNHQLWISGLDEPSARPVNTALLSVARASMSDCDQELLWIKPRETRKLLGGAFDAVVLEAHSEWSADVIGQCHGLVWGGGALVIRLDTRPRHIGLFAERLERALQGQLTWCAPDQGVCESIDLSLTPLLPSLPPLDPPSRQVETTSDQVVMTEQLYELLCERSPQRIVITAARGRGKSSALGLAIARLRTAERGSNIVITAGTPTATREIFRFALGAPKIEAAGPVCFRAPHDLLSSDPIKIDLLFIDEAAQLPVPVLQMLVTRYTETHIVFATTTRGYEGTGRGFLLRFLKWLSTRPEQIRHLSLHEPVRWSPDDPLERFVLKTLILDYELHSAPMLTRGALDQVEHVIYRDRRKLAYDEISLCGVFGLLVHAHYRTTPDDLQRLLDAPNIEVHALRFQGRVIAATLIAHEGALSLDTCERMYWGRERIKGHAIADVLVSHLSELEGGALRIIRSVRIAVHPDLRRLGLGSRLIECVHATYQPDLFGTLFGVTEGLLDFRRNAGYELAWVSASRGARTGEPSALMIYPRSSRAQALLSRLRDELSRDLPSQLMLFTNGYGLVLSDALRQDLLKDLDPTPKPRTEAEFRRRVAAYVFGPRTFESSVTVLSRFVEEYRDDVARLSPREQALINARVRDRLDWERVRAQAQLPSLSSSMRGLRGGLRSLALISDPMLRQDWGPSSRELNCGVE